ncbi:hypothetical protein [Acidicapsa ligni]|uniref:hypothetical protein n=1 Tax=Acidicapsa ligni TaxID=542300 RepID=UPI0021E09E10|nr:hypothetical protein [Acidicapsa ligni]
MKNTLFIACIAATLATSVAAQPNNTASSEAKATAHSWTGVWAVKEANKPGVTITLADDNGALIGTIVFDIYKRQTNEHIGTEPRTVVNPHLEGNALAFQVRRILKPHLKSDPPASEDQPDPTDIVDMTLTHTSDGKATLTCAKCGSISPTELVKE